MTAFHMVVYIPDISIPKGLFLQSSYKTWFLSWKAPRKLSFLMVQVNAEEDKKDWVFSTQT